MEHETSSDLFCEGYYSLTLYDKAWNEIPRGQWVRLSFADVTKMMLRWELARDPIMPRILDSLDLLLSTTHHIGLEVYDE